VGQGGSSSSTSDQLTQNFDVSQENDTTTVAPGALSRLSVAVVVNGALTAAQARLVRATVEAAVGYDPARHDQISVVGLPFNQALLNRMMQQPLPTAGGLLARPWLVPALAAAVPLVAVAAFVLGRRRRAEPDAAPPPAAEGAADADGLGAELPLVDGDVGATVQAARAARQRMEAALRDRPEDVARVIRAWMAEDG
jgi:flagellar M-ring protein FliF